MRRSKSDAYSGTSRAGNAIRLAVAALVLLAALTPAAVAQRLRPTSHFAARNQHSQLRRHSSPDARRSLPFPFFDDLFDSNDIYSTGYPVASDPPEFPGAQSLSLRSLQGQGGDFDPVGVPPRPNTASGPSQPLLIELQNGRYVRVNSPAIDGEALPLKPDSNRAPTTSARESAPALLIFRDGHTEEVRDYTIADGILYAHGDFYTDGYWNKKIDLSTLDLPQTQQANAKRNVNFILPSYPNEVITSF